jgi:chromosomal replication initiator protein
VNDLQSRRGTKSTSHARQISLFLCRRFTSASLNELGAHFGGKDHTTILYSIRKVDRLRREDATVQTDLDRLVQEIERR